MFKLVVLSCVLAVALAKPSAVASPVIGKLVSEKTIESHGNSVIHASAPVIAPAVPLVKTIEPVVPLITPVIAAKAAAIISEKTIESHGHSIIHNSAPATAIPYVAPSVPFLTAAPLLAAPTKQPEQIQHQSPESLESSQNQQLLKKLENIAQQSNKEKLESPQQRNETEQPSKQYFEKSEPQGQFFIHQAGPATLSYLAAAAPLVPALAPLAPVAPVAPLAIAPPKQLLHSGEAHQQSANKLDSPHANPQLSERQAENGAIQEIATGLHLAAAPIYYYHYPAAVLAERSIHSYGHSIVHGA